MVHGISFLRATGVNRKEDRKDQAVALSRTGVSPDRRCVGLMQDAEQTLIIMFHLSPPSQSLSESEPPTRNLIRSWCGERQGKSGAGEVRSRRIHRPSN